MGDSEPLWVGTGRWCSSTRCGLGQGRNGGRAGGPRHSAGRTVKTIQINVEVKYSFERFDERNNFSYINFFGFEVNFELKFREPSRFEFE
jgi:hypothetical protein